MFLERLMPKYSGNDIASPTSNPRYIGELIAHDRNGTSFSMQFIAKTDLTIAGGNMFEGLSKAIGDTAIGSGLQKALKTVGTVSTVATGANQAINVAQSESTWQGGRNPTFELDISLVCLKSGDPKYDLTKIVSRFMRLVYPDITGSGNLRPPLGYTSSIKGKFANSGEQGKVTLRLGEWFLARKLIVDSVSITFGKQLNKDGKPILAEGRITLTPYRQISHKELLEYFKM